MRSSLRRRLAIGCVAAAACGAVPAAASAAPIPLTNWSVTGGLTLAKLKQTIAFPPGSKFNGGIDLRTFEVTGHVTIPPFTTRLRILGLPVDATLNFVEAQPLSGFAKAGPPPTVDVTGSDTVQITRLSSPLLPLNLAGSRCRTSTPVVLALHHDGALTGAPATFTGKVTIPTWSHCGLATALLDLLLSGPNNPITVTIAPPPPGT